MTSLLLQNIQNKAQDTSQSIENNFLLHKDQFKYLKTTHPYYLVDPSSWPAVASLGAFMITSGLVLYMHKFIGGWNLFILGFLLISYVMYTWWRDIVREATFEEQHSVVVQKGLRLGMILFIVFEVLNVDWGFMFDSLTGIFFLIFHLLFVLYIYHVYKNFTSTSVLEKIKFHFKNTYFLKKRVAAFLSYKEWRSLCPVIIQVADSMPTGGSAYGIAFVCLGGIAYYCHHLMIQAANRRHRRFFGGEDNNNAVEMEDSVTEVIPTTLETIYGSPFGPRIQELTEQYDFDTDNLVSLFDKIADLKTWEELVMEAMQTTNELGPAQLEVFGPEYFQVSEIFASMFLVNLAYIPLSQSTIVARYASFMLGCITEYLYGQVYYDTGEVPRAVMPVYGPIDERLLPEERPANLGPQQREVHVIPDLEVRPRVPLHAPVNPIFREGETHTIPLREAVRNMPLRPGISGYLPAEVGYDVEERRLIVPPKTFEGKFKPRFFTLTGDERKFAESIYSIDTTGYDRLELNDCESAGSESGESMDSSGLVQHGNRAQKLYHLVPHGNRLRYLTVAYSLDPKIVFDFYRLMLSFSNQASMFSWANEVKSNNIGSTSLIHYHEFEEIAGLAVEMREESWADLSLKEASILTVATQYYIIKGR